MKSLTPAQRGILDILQHGLTVKGIRYCKGSEYFRAECEYLPRILMSSLNVLERQHLVEYEMEDYMTRIYRLPDVGHRRGNGK